MPWVYSIITVLIGLFFYWLRSHYRAWYGLSEMIVAFALMYVVYFLMVGLLFLPAVVLFRRF